MRAMIVLLFLLLAPALASIGPGSARADDWADLVTEIFEAEVVALDGDTLLILGPAGDRPLPDLFVSGETRVRLWGISAPEMKDAGLPPPGWLSLGALDDLLAENGQQVICAVIDIHRPRRGKPRPVARCQTGEEDLAMWLVRNGWAVSYRVYSWRNPIDRGMARHLDDLQAEARAAGRGLWARPTD